MFSLEKRRLRSDVRALFKYLKGCHMEDGTDLFATAFERRTRTNGKHCKRRDFDWISEKKFLMIRAVGKWNRLA